MALRLLFLLPLLSLSTVAVAQERPPQYFGLSIGEYELEDEVNGQNFDAEFTNIGLEGGYRFSRFLGVEGRFSYGRDDSSNTLDDPELIMGGAFVRFDLPFERINVYALAGGSVVDYDVGIADDDVSGGSGGIGIELFGSDTTALKVEYVSHAGGDYEGVGIGFTHHFNWPSFR